MMKRAISTSPTTGSNTDTIHSLTGLRSVAFAMAIAGLHLLLISVPKARATFLAPQPLFSLGSSESDNSLNSSFFFTILVAL